MAKTLINVSATTTGTNVGTVDRRRDHVVWKATFFAYGTFGGGTVAYYWSPDNGTTLMPLTDYSGNPITSAANDSFNSELCTGSHNTDKITIWIALNGATSPSLTIGFYDNN